MSLGYDALLAEADRIVNSPYPTQLKQLHTIACSKCSDTDVLRWASSRPCQVDALARSLLEALQNWPYVLDIITKLSTSRRIRDALLQRNPNLLFETVSQAVSGSWKHNAASIAILSHSLPQNVTLPAACQNLFLGIVDHAAQSPSSASMRPVYRLLKGGLGPLLGLLSHEVLSQIEDHFLETLQNTIGQEDQCLSLYCFSVMKTVVAAAEEDVSFSSASGKYETQELLASTPNSPRWKPEGMQKFFNAGRKAHKALHLIVVRVLYSTQFTDKDAVEEVIECLGLANELVQYLPESVREAWCAQNPLVVQKLQERALQPGLDTRMRLQAFAFLFSLCRSRDIPEPVIDRLSQLLVEPTLLIGELAVGVEPAMARFAELLSSGSLCDLFTPLGRFALSAEAPELMRYTDAIVATIHCLTASCDPSNNISAGAIAAMGSSLMAESLSKLRHTFSKNPDTSTISSNGACDAVLLQTRKTIAHALCNLFLKAALTADHTQTDIASDFYPLLIDLHAMSTTPEGSCTHVKQQSELSTVDGSQSNIPTPAPGADWRQVLDRHLQSRAQHEQNTLSKLFAYACDDLERRCSDVEAPLREERLKRVELQERYDSLARDHSGLEDEKNRVLAYVADLEADKKESARDVDEAREENDGLLARIADLEAKARKDQDAAQEQLARMKRYMDTAAMEHATDLANNQEHLEDAQAKLAETRATIVSKDAAAAALQAQLASADSAKVAFDTDRQAWANTGDEYKRAIAVAEQAQDELSARCTKLLSDLDAAQEILLAEKRSHQDILTSARDQAEQDLRTVKDKGARRAVELENQHHGEMESLKQTMATTHQMSHQALEETNAQVAKRDRKLAECLKKMEQLKGVVTERDEQIAEANAMRLNLMAAMGLGKHHSQATNRRTTHSVATKEAAVGDSDISIPFVDMLGSTAKSTAQRGLDFATQGSQAAPSPKRAKARNSVRTMSPSQTLLATFSQAAKDDKQDRVSAKRQPLLTLSANRSPGKGGSKTSLKGWVEEWHAGEADDDTTFEGSEVFSCTPAVRGRNGDEEVLLDDETMLE